MAGYLSVKTKMSDFEARVLIGWLANTLRQPANQNTCLKVKMFFCYVDLPFLLRIYYVLLLWCFSLSD